MEGGATFQHSACCSPHRAAAVRPSRDGETRVALGSHRAAVQLDQLFHDGKAETEPTFLARARSICLAKSLEQVRQEIAGDASTGVFDRNHQLEIDPLQADLDDTSFGRELDGIGEKVAEHLLETAGVPADPRAPFPA